MSIKFSWNSTQSQGRADITVFNDDRDSTNSTHIYIDNYIYKNKLMKQIDDSFKDLGLILSSNELSLMESRQMYRCGSIYKINMNLYRGNDLGRDVEYFTTNDYYFKALIKDLTKDQFCRGKDEYVIDIRQR